MPALVRLFSEEPPSAAVADSSFLFQALIDPHEGDGRHEACRAFLGSLFRAGTEIVVSPLLFVEAPASWRRLYNRGALEGATRQAAYEQASQALRELLGELLTTEVTLTRELIESATSLAGRYNLNAHDAVHVAVAREVQVADIITLDRDFVRVDELVVWRPAPPSVWEA